MMRRAGWWGVVLVLGLAPASFGQFGGGMGGGMGGMGGGMGGVMFQDFGTAGADSPRAARVAVRVTAGDGKMIKGHLRLTSAVVGSSLGVYEIKPEKVREIRLGGKDDGAEAPVMVGPGGAQKAGSIVTVGGDVIEGHVLIPQWWRIETDLGTLRPNAQALKSISFFKEQAGPAEEQLEPIPNPGTPPTNNLIPAPGELSPPAELVPIPSTTRTRRVSPPSPPQTRRSS